MNPCRPNGFSQVQKVFSSNLLSQDSYIAKCLVVMKRKMFQFAIGENRIVITPTMTLIDFLARALCTMLIMKLHPLFIYMCICMFKNDIFPCAVQGIIKARPYCCHGFLICVMVYPGESVVCLITSLLQLKTGIVLELFA